MIHFSYPAGGLLALLPVLIYFLFPAAQKMYGDALKVPFVDALSLIKEKAGSGIEVGVISISLRLRLLLLSVIWLLCAIALARPQWAGEPMRIKNEARDILLVVDISNSMAENDFEYQNTYYDRLTAVKNVVSQFIDKRTEDRMGLVLFGSRAYMQVPLTFDKQSLKEVLWETDAGMAGNSTAIGDAIGVALKNITQDAKKSENKVIILLTDGENNDGKLSLAQAISLAKDEKVKVYTIGVASDSKPFFGGFFNIPVNSGLDERSLYALAEETKANYYRAKDVKSLLKIYDEINKLEPQENEGRYVQEVKDLYYYPAGLAMLLFVVLMMFTRKVW